MTQCEFEEADNKVKSIINLYEKYATMSTYDELSQQTDQQQQRMSEAQKPKTPPTSTNEFQPLHTQPTGSPANSRPQSAASTIQTPQSTSNNKNFNE